MPVEPTSEIPDLGSLVERVIFSRDHQAWYGMVRWVSFTQALLSGVYLGVVVWKLFCSY